MSFEEYYQTVIKQANIKATIMYVRVLFDYDYTIEESVQNLKNIKK